MLHLTDYVEVYVSSLKWYQGLGVRLYLRILMGSNKIKKSRSLNCDVRLNAIDYFPIAHNALCLPPQILHKLLS